MSEKESNDLPDISSSSESSGSDSSPDIGLLKLYDHQPQRTSFD